MDSNYLLTQYGVMLEIDITPHGASRTWTPMCAGFTNLDEALNEQTQEYFFLCAKGFGADFIIGMHPKFSLTGVRIVGDAAQDYIFGLKYETMEGRITNFRYSLANADGTVSRWTFSANLSNIKSFGGATTDGAAVSVDVGMQGKPLFETVAATGSVTVTSEAGAATGQTVIKAAPTYPDAGCKFVYAYGKDAPTATTGNVLVGWNDFTNGATYEIPNGQNVTVAMINISTYVVVASGSAVVVSKT